MTILEKIKISTEYLKQNGITNPGTSSEILLAHVLGVKRLNLYLDYDRELTGKEQEIFNRLYLRRGNHEPLQYITGETEFMSLPFKVNSSVLVPRPETEFLVEIIIDFYRSNWNTGDFRVVEIGVGSGNLSVSLAHYISCSVIVATDIDKKAVKLARENAIRNGVDKKIDFRVSDIFEAKDGDFSDVHVVVSNPPYVAEDEREILQKEVIDHEPHIALFSEKDDLRFYKTISNLANKWLIPGGMLVFETAYNKGGKVVEIVKNAGFKKVQLTKDYAKFDRVVTGIQ